MSTATLALRARIESIDVVRGIAMILMALDHTRDYFGMPGADPVNMATATAPLFLTRWVTHLCAPAFFFLMGTGAALSSRRRSRAELSRFLLTRGLWLVVLELTLVRFALQFNVDYRVTMLLVIWALGWSLVALSALLWLPVWAIASIGVAMIAGHNLLDGIRLAHPLWAILHGPGLVLNTPGHTVFASYVLVPWVGVTAAGYGLGRLYEWEPGRRRRALLMLGLVVTGAFFLVRTVNGYGDPSPARELGTGVLTLLSFLNTTKYPPSLLFLLMTLGPTLLLLAALDGRTPAWLRPASIVGKVPLFYFMLHFLLIHALAVVVCYVRYGDAHWMFESPDLGNYPFTAPPGWGFALPIIYTIWIAVVVSLYPLCRRFATVKQRRSGGWLSYL